MTKADGNDFGPEFWLHVATDAMRRYAEEGGPIYVNQTEKGISVLFAGVSMANPDVHEKFAAMAAVSA